MITCFAFPSRLAYYSQDGGAGAIREAGGSFGKKEAADEERYFRKMVGIYSFDIYSYLAMILNMDDSKLNS